MSYNGSGVFNLPSGNPVVTGTTISSTVHNNTMADVASGLSNVLCKDGQSTPTANIKMGGFKFTGLAAGTTAGDSIRYDEFNALNTTVTNLNTTVTGNLVGFKNRLINAQGLINQRAYVSGTATTTTNQYTLDRWRVVVSGQNLTFTTTNNETTFTAPSGGVEQVIEGLNLESGTYTLSWTGTATATVDGSAVANGGQVTVVGGTNTTLRFINGTYKNPQFEKGSTATSFDYRPYGTELSLCQRYYELVSGVALTTANSSFGMKTNKRAVPTIALASISSGFGFGCAPVDTHSLYQSSANSVVSAFVVSASAEL